MASVFKSISVCILAEMIRIIISGERDMNIQAIQNRERPPEYFDFKIQCDVCKKAIADLDGVFLLSGYGTLIPVHVGCHPRQCRNFPIREVVAQMLADSLVSV